MEDAAEAKRYLREGASDLASAQIFAKGQGEMIATQVSKFDDHAGFLYVVEPLKDALDTFEKEVTKSGTKECFFNVSLAKATIFFKAEYMGSDDFGLKFKQPEKVFKVQRRKHLRCPIPPGYVLKVEFEDPITGAPTSFKALDISAGGLSFSTTEADEVLFKNGTVLKKISFTLHSKKVSVDGTVCYARMVPGPIGSPVLKVGVEFNNLQPTDIKNIETYVSYEMRKMFGMIVG